MRKTLYRGTLLIGLALLLAAPWPGAFFALQATRLSDGEVLFSLPFFRRHLFDLAFTHSLHLAPVVEKFEIIGGEIHLREIQTNHWGVVDYYGIPGRAQQEGGRIRIREIRFQTSALTLAIGFSGKQRLIWEERIIPLHELSEPGGRLRLESRALSPARYFLAKAGVKGSIF